MAGWHVPVNASEVTNLTTIDIIHMALILIRWHLSRLLGVGELNLVDQCRYILWHLHSPLYDDIHEWCRFFHRFGGISGILASPAIG
jgi:hypothetical protein